MVRDITRPLVNLTYISDTAVWGTRPFGYHLTNVVLHALNVIAVFWVAFGAAEDWRSRGGGRYGFSPSPRVVGLVTSLLAAAHPIMTQAVGYITGRSELLYGLFFLLAWLAARRWMHVGGWWRSAALLLWALSVLAKETAAMLPVILWCYDAWLIPDGDGNRIRRIKGFYAPLGLAVLLFGVGRLAVLATLEYPQDVGPSWRYVFVETDAFWRYVALFVLPKGQTLVHTIPSFTTLTFRAVAGAIGLVGLVGVAWSLRRIQALVSLGIVVLRGDAAAVERPLHHGDRRADGRAPRLHVGNRLLPGVGRRVRDGMVESPGLRTRHDGAWRPGGRLRRAARRPDRGTQRRVGRCRRPGQGVHGAIAGALDAAPVPRRDAPPERPVPRRHRRIPRGAGLARPRTPSRARSF